MLNRHSWAEGMRRRLTLACFKRRRTYVVADEAPDYSIAFDDAARFTEAAGFRVGFRHLGGRDCLNNDVLAAVIEAIEPVNVSSSAGQCLRWSHFLEPIVSQLSKTACELTIGQLWIGGRGLFTPTWAELDRMHRSGVPEPAPGRGSLSLHAWITLSTGEIVDPSIASSLARFSGARGIRPGAISYGRPDLMARGSPSWKYVPMVIGRSWAEHIDERSGGDLLARTLAELEHIAVRFAW